MPTFNYVDVQGRRYAQVIAESRLAALGTREARDHRFFDVREAGTGGRSARNGDEDLLLLAEARLQEAFERLGLTDREVAQAIRGRAAPWERKSLTDVPPTQGTGNLRGDPDAGGRRPVSRRLTEPTTPGERARRARDQVDESRGSDAERIDRAVTRITGL